MVHKKYTYKKGKKFGPYYYETKRVKGKVVTTYLGRDYEKQESKRTHNISADSLHNTFREVIKKFENRKDKSHNHFFIIFGFIAIILFLLLLWFNYLGSITGQASLNVKSEYAIGEIIDGNLILNLREGELIPKDAKVVLSVNKEEKEISLFELVSGEFEVITGDFFAEDIALSGSGEGYGIKGKKIVYPDVYFDLLIFNIEGKEISAGAGAGNEASNTDGVIGQEVIEEDTDEEKKELEEEAGSEDTVQEDAGEVKEDGSEGLNDNLDEILEESEKEKESEDDEGSVEESDAGSEDSGEESSITGFVVSKEELVLENLIVSKDKEYEYGLENSQSAKIVEGSVNSEGFAIDEDKLKIEVKSKKVTVSTEYSVVEERFGEDFLGDELFELEVDLENFGFIAENDSVLKAKLVFDGIIIVEVEKELFVEKEIDEDEAVNESMINETTEIQIQVLNKTLVNLTDVDFVGVNITQEQAVLGKPVKWRKVINSTKPANLVVEIPASAENVTLKKISEEFNEEASDQDAIEESDISEMQENHENNSLVVVGLNGETISGFVISDLDREIGGSWLKKFFAFTGLAVEENIEENKTKEIVIEINSSGGGVFEIEYTTKAPSIGFEEELKNGKRVLVTGPDDVHYENVLIFTSINESLGFRAAEKIIIVWEEKNTRIKPQTVLDSDDNGIFDYVEWIAPELSNQTFSIIEITEAEHLDENRSFVSNIFPEVSELDNIWSEEIPDMHYVRVKFERKLNSENDISIYLRTISGNPKIEVYEFNESEVIAEFIDLTDNRYNKVILTNLHREQDVFDLYILDGSVEIDHVIDPILYIRANDDGTTDSANPFTVSINSTPNVSYAVLIQSESSSDEQYSNEFFKKTKTSFQVKTEDDTGVNDGTTFHWAAINYGEYALGSDKYIKCGNVGSVAVINVTFGTPFNNASYSAICTPQNDSDSPACQVQPAGFKNASGFPIHLQDDGGLDEVVNSTDWCAFSFGEYSVGSTLIKSGLNPQWVGNLSVSFSNAFPDTNYVVFTTPSEGAADDPCVCEINTRTTTFFNATCVDDGTSIPNCDGEQYHWVAFTIGDRNESIPGPLVTINVPINKTYNTNELPLQFNVSLNENGSVMYTLNNGVNNYSMQGNETAASYSSFGFMFNHTNVSISDGSYTFHVYANDTGGNNNYTTNVTFSFDNIPNVGFVSPTPTNATTQTTGAVYVNVSSRDLTDHYAFVNFNRDLVLWMRMDDRNSSGDPQDISGYGNNGTFKNEVLINVTGYFGNGSHYDGTDDAIQINDPGPGSVLDFAGNFTISAWFNLHGLPTAGAGRNPRIFQKGDNSDDSGYILYVNTSRGVNRSSMEIDLPPSGGTESVYSTTKMIINRWNHLVSTRAGTNLSIYVNGVIENSSILSTSGSLSETNEILHIGESPGNLDGSANGIIDEAIIFKRALTGAEVAALYNASRYQYGRNFTFLGVGKYNYTAYAVDLNALKNSTERTVTITSASTAPNDPVVAINSTLGTNRTSEDLFCKANITDPDNGKINVTVRWFNDTITHIVHSYNNSYSSGEFFNATLLSGNTTKGDNWNCSLVLFDGASYSSQINSSTIRILNTPPTAPSLSSPADSASTTDRTPAFSWSAATDADSDTLTYNLNISCYKTTGGSCTISGNDNRFVTGISGTSHTLIGDLLYFRDNNYYYNWTVRATDGASNGSFAVDRRLNITALITLSLPNDTIEFGVIDFEQGANDTSDDKPFPFRIQNDGNAMTNITIGAGNLWITQANPSTFYRFKADNNSLENYSFNWGSSTTVYTNIPATGSPVMCIAELNYTDVSDTAEIDINVTVPDNEPSGVRSSTVTFTGSLAEN